MPVPALLLLGLLASAEPPLPELPEPRPLDMSLDQLTAMGDAEFARRAAALLGDGYIPIVRYASGYSAMVTYRSAARRAGPGLCEATEVDLTWAAPLQQLPPDHYRHRWPPPDRAAPLRFHSRHARRVYHWLGDRPRSSRPAARACSRLDRGARFLHAESADYLRVAARLLRTLKRRLARNPAALEIDCRGWRDCVERVRAASISDLVSVTPCDELAGETRPNCYRFNLPPDVGISMVGTKGFEIDVEGADAAARIVRLRWRAMAHHFD